jgi:hypothetical protein
MNTSTVSVPNATVVPAEVVADAAEAPADTAEARSAEAMRCSEAVSRADVNVFAEVTCERPSWSCSMSHPATGTKSSKS